MQVMVYHLECMTDIAIIDKLCLAGLVCRLFMTVVCTQFPPDEQEVMLNTHNTALLTFELQAVL